MSALNWVREKATKREEYDIFVKEAGYWVTVERFYFAGFLNFKMENALKKCGNELIQTEEVYETILVKKGQKAEYFKNIYKKKG